MTSRSKMMIDDIAEIAIGAFAGFAIGFAVVVFWL